MDDSPVFVSAAAPLQPPLDAPLPGPRGDWFTLPAADPAAAIVSTHLWTLPQPPVGWEAARLSAAVFLVREAATGWSVVAKYYAAKTGGEAAKYAARELELTQQALVSGLADAPLRAVRPLGLWRGVLFLEHVPGLTLDDVIAVRRSRPGTLLPALEQAAALLARLHTHGAQPDEPPDFAESVGDIRKLVSTLTRHGVLQDAPLVVEGLERAIARWEADPAMAEFVPALNHGDATTTNFVYPWEGGVVGIDWERARAADPAADLGRLLAETLHSLMRHGGTMAEGLALTGHVQELYCQSLPDSGGSAALVKRARFYQAASTLRIARNGWLPRSERSALVMQALALLV